MYEFYARRRLADLTFLRDPLLSDVMPPPFQEAVKALAAKAMTDAEKSAASLALGRLQIAMTNAKRLTDAGILLAAGTDAAYPGDYYGEGLHRELELLVEAGLTPLQAITAATKNAALLLAEADDWGTLAPGRRADFLIVAGDPSKRIEDTQKIESVFHAGRILDRAKLRFDPAKDPGYRPAGTVSGNH